MLLDKTSSKAHCDHVQVEAGVPSVAHACLSARKPQAACLISELLWPECHPVLSAGAPLIISSWVNSNKPGAEAHFQPLKRVARQLCWDGALSQALDKPERSLVI